MLGTAWSDQSVSGFHGSNALAENEEIVLYEVESLWSTTIESTLVEYVERREIAARKLYMQGRPDETGGRP